MNPLNTVIEPAAVTTPAGFLRFGGNEVSGVNQPKELFPVFLKLDGRPVLLVGAGVVATSKLASLLDAGATVTVVAPRVSNVIRESGVRIHQRRFRATDLDRQWLVVAAATPTVNRAVARAAERRQIFVNAVDDPPNATAYLGGVVRRAGVTLAISTSGRAPALAGLLREGLDEMLPADLDIWMQRADAIRAEWRQTKVPMEARRPQLLETLVELYRDRGRVDSGVVTG